MGVCIRDGGGPGSVKWGVVVNLSKETPACAAAHT